MCYVYKGEVRQPLGVVARVFIIYYDMEKSK